MFGYRHQFGFYTLNYAKLLRLMPAEYVRPYVKSNKNDFIDAEAVLPPTMRFVLLKTEEQLDLQALH